MERELRPGYTGAWPPALWCPSAHAEPPGAASVAATVAGVWWVASAAAVIVQA